MFYKRNWLFYKSLLWIPLAGFVPVGDSGVVHLPAYLSTVISSVDLILLESAAASYQSRAPPTFIL
jgi:hypothetical protein